MPVFARLRSVSSLSACLASVRFSPGLTPDPLGRPEHVERPRAGSEEEEHDQPDGSPRRRQEPIGDPPEREPDAPICAQAATLPAF